MKYEEAKAKAEEIKKEFPSLVVGVAEKGGRFTIVTGSNRSRLNKFAKAGFAIHEF